MGVKSPCLGCENRAQGCYAVCIKYYSFRLTLDAEKKKAKEAKKAYDVRCEPTETRHRKWIQDKKRRG